MSIFGKKSEIPRGPWDSLICQPSALRTDHAQISRRFAGLLLLALVASSSGCRSVQVKEVAQADYFQGRRADLLSSGTLSQHASQTLQAAGTTPVSCSSNIDRCLEALDRSSAPDIEAQLSALAELWILKGATQTGDESIAAYLEAARYAYGYLFYTPRSPADRSFNERQAQVLDYYNFSVEKVATGLFTKQSSTSGIRSALPTEIELGRWSIQVEMGGLQTSLQTRLPKELVPASSLGFRGLRNVYERAGVGADMVAVIGPPALGSSEQSSSRSEMSFPATSALLEFPAESLSELRNSSSVIFKGYDPYRWNRVPLAGHTVPLSANFSAGYGLWLARSGFAKQSVSSMLGRSGGITRPQLFLMQPFDPNRKILLLLHGLGSGPEAWVNVANEIQGDEGLRDHYQIWQVYYPTNQPVLWNHAQIRSLIEQALGQFDPQHSTPASHDMVLLGHSMGGLIARLMSSDSGTKLWNAFLAQVPTAKQSDAKVLESRARQWLFFHPMPSVGRAIFIAAPHRGSNVAGGSVAKLVGRFIRLPKTILDELGELSGLIGKHAPSSIESLQESNPIVSAMGQLQISPQIPYHTLVGRRQSRGALQDSDDGAVPYRSAHLEGAQSELVLEAGHSLQNLPQATLEIRRILRLHLASLPANPTRSNVEARK